MHVAGACLYRLFKQFVNEGYHTGGIVIVVRPVFIDT
jgi:hypothetical protein